jgi:flavin reductase (DIM6/NTAB) family NADH-FMN oxidoreductase RutF
MGSYNYLYPVPAVLKSNIFSVNIPSIDNVIKADYCGIISGAKEDKSEIFKTFYGKTNAPMIEECPVNIECKVIKQFVLNGMEIFIGEVVNSYINEEWTAEPFKVKKNMNFI